MSRQFGFTFPHSCFYDPDNFEINLKHVLFFNYRILFFSPNVRQYIWKRIGDHPTVILGHSEVPHANAESARIHQVPPDTEPAETATRRILSGITEWYCLPNK